MKCKFLSIIMEDLCKCCCKKYYFISHKIAGNSRIYHERDAKISF